MTPPMTPDVRHGQGKTQWADLVVFSMGVALALVGFDTPADPRLIVAAEAAISLYFYWRNFAIFTPSLFLLILALTLLVFEVPSFWLFNILMAIAVYGAVVFAIAPLRKASTLHGVGRFDAVTAFAGLAIVAGAAGALAAWKAVAGPDLSQYGEIIPEVGPGLLVAGIFGFSLFNAVAEEFIFRGVLWDAFGKLLPGPLSVIIVQAVFFGLSHYKGVPSGGAGVALAAVYGVALGFLRHRSGGLGPPVAVHVFADFTVSFIVLAAIGRI